MVPLSRWRAGAIVTATLARPPRTNKHAPSSPVGSSEGLARSELYLAHFSGDFYPARGETKQERRST